MKDDVFKLLGGFADKLTDGQTFVIVESLSRLKKLLMTIWIHIMLTPVSLL